MHKLGFDDFFSWKQEPIQIGMLSLSWQRIAQILQVEFEEDLDDLGLYKFVVLKSKEEIFYFLTAHPDSPTGDKVVVAVQANNLYPIKALNDLVLALGLEDGVIEWRNLEFLEKGLWRIMRQDDNGNVFVIAHYYDEESASRICKTLEARGHKQLYWFEKISHSQPQKKTELFSD